MTTNKVVISATTTLAVFVAFTGCAAAWTYGVTGAGKCQPDGSYKIAWKVDNTTEPDALTIQTSSNPDVVKPGITVAGKGMRTFYQVVNGTKPATYNLSLTGNWQADTGIRTRSASVMLKTACDQPAPVSVTPQPDPKPTTPVVASASTTTPVVAPAPQVVPSRPAVNAGGGYQAASPVATAGLVGSILTALLGVGLVVHGRFGGKQKA